jgi:predicted nucleic acid-binding protein
MSGNKFLLDTNVIINHLNGNETVAALLEDSYLYISAITFTELLSKQLTEKENVILLNYLGSVHVIHTNEFICKTASHLRKKSKIKLPDAIIASTSLFLDIPLVTFDNDFDKINDLNILKLSL